MCMKDNAKFSIPVIIQKFINCSMDLKLFRVEAYTDLVHEAIDNHISSSPFDILFLSTYVIGNTSAAVPVKNSSSA